MNKQDVIDLLGEPDRIMRGPMMTSKHWFCPTCAKLHTFATPVRPPAPCECGGIIFEKRSEAKTKGDDNAKG